MSILDFRLKSFVNMSCFTSLLFDVSFFFEVCVDVMCACLYIYID